MLRRKLRITPEEEDDICKAVWDSVIKSINSDVKEKVYLSVSEILNRDIDISRLTVLSVSHSINTDIDMNQMILSLQECRESKIKRSKRKNKKK